MGLFFFYFFFFRSCTVVWSDSFLGDIGGPDSNWLLLWCPAALLYMCRAFRGFWREPASAWRNWHILVWDQPPFVIPKYGLSRKRTISEKRLVLLGIGLTTWCLLGDPTLHIPTSLTHSHLMLDTFSTCSFWSTCTNGTEKGHCRISDKTRDMDSVVSERNDGVMKVEWE